MKKPLQIGLLYLSLHTLLKNKYGEGNIVTREELFCCLGKHFVVPKNQRPVIIKEMERRELLKQENRENIRILKCEIDLNNISELYEKVGIFTFI